MAVTGLDERYDWWSDVLTTAFFANPGKPCVLSIDDTELAKLSGTDDALGDLAMAVRRAGGPRSGSDLFPRLTSSFRAWERTGRDGLPPVLPLLALTVLAASRMANDGAYSRSNYHVRFGRILAAAGINGSDDELRSLSNRGFDVLADMWRGLDRLLRESGTYGASTIRDHPTLTRIGFPISQTLVAAADRAHLTQFFARLDIASIGVPDDAALLACLRRWASRPRGLGHTFLRALTDDELARLLTPVVAALAASWDGIVADPGGRRALDLRVALDLDSGTARWVIPADESVPSATLTGALGPGDTRAEICAEPGRRYYTITGLPAADGPSCREGARLRGDGVVATFQPSSVLFFRQDPFVGGWVTCGAMIPFEDHVVAAAGEYAAVVRDVIEIAADTGWKTVPQRPGAALLAGFTIYRKVRFSDERRFLDAVGRLPHGKARVVLPDSTLRPRLLHGLPLARDLGPGSYFVGGAPDLLLPVGDSTRRVDVSLDGVTTSLRATGFPLPLRDMGLEAGEHELQADGDVLRFTLLESDPRRLVGSGEILSWDATARLGPHEPGRPVLANGALVAGADVLETVAAQRGRDETLVIHTDGSMLLIEEPPESSLFAERGLQRSPMFEVDLGLEAAWLAQRRGWAWSITPVHPGRRPLFTAATLSPEDKAAWARLVGNGPEDDDEWLAFLEAAGVE